MIVRSRSADHATAQHIRKQLTDLGIVQRSAHADTSVELAAPVVEVLRWLTNRQRLSSAAVLTGYLADLESLGQTLDRCLRLHDAEGAMLALRDVDSLVERVRALSEQNREAVIAEAQQLRSAAGVTAVERFRGVAWLWERYLEPLRQLVDADGEMERRLGGLRSALEIGEQAFVMHGAAHRAFARSVARLVRMRRDARRDHLSAVHEVAPLYQRLRRDTHWLGGAAAGLRRIREGQLPRSDLARRLGLGGSRPRFVMSDDALRAQLAALHRYEPASPPVLDPAPAAPPPPFVPRDLLREALAAAGSIDDVLAFILLQWPDLPLQAQLRAYGDVVSGDFGAVALAHNAAERRYPIPGGEIRAWPLTLGPRAA